MEKHKISTKQYVDTSVGILISLGMIAAFLVGLAFIMSVPGSLEQVPESPTTQDAEQAFIATTDVTAAKPVALDHSIEFQGRIDDRHNLWFGTLNKYSGNYIDGYESDTPLELSAHYPYYASYAGRSVAKHTVKVNTASQEKMLCIPPYTFPRSQVDEKITLDMYKFIGEHLHSSLTMHKWDVPALIDIYQEDVYKIVFEVYDSEDGDWPGTYSQGPQSDVSAPNDQRWFEVNAATGRHGYNIGTDNGSTPPNEVGNTPWEAYWCGGWKTDDSQSSQQCQCVDFSWDSFSKRTTKTTDDDRCRDFNQLGCDRDDDDNNLLQLRAIWDPTTNRLTGFEGALCDNTGGSGYVLVRAHVYMKTPIPYEVMNLGRFIEIHENNSGLKTWDVVAKGYTIYEEDVDKILFQVYGGEGTDWANAYQVDVYDYCSGIQSDVPKNDPGYNVFEVNAQTGRHGYFIGSQDGSAPPQEIGDTPWEAYWCGGIEVGGSVIPACSQESQSCDCVDFSWDSFLNRTATTHHACEDFDQYGCTRDHDDTNMFQIRPVWDETTRQLLRFEGALCDNTPGEGYIDVRALVYLKELSPTYYFSSTGQPYADPEITQPIACSPDVCFDGTMYGECNAVTKQYCDDGTLVYDCSKCGYQCTGDLNCNWATGTCVTCVENKDCSDYDCMTEDICNNPGQITSSCTYNSLSSDGCRADQECGISPQGCACGVCEQGYHCAGNTECSPTTSCNPKTGEGCPIVNSLDAPIAD